MFFLGQSRRSFDPMISVEDLDRFTFNIVPERDVVPMLDDKAQNYQCTSHKMDGSVIYVVSTMFDLNCPLALPLCFSHSLSRRVQRCGRMPLTHSCHLRDPLYLWVVGPSHDL